MAPTRLRFTVPACVLLLAVAMLPAASQQPADEHLSHWNDLASRDAAKAYRAIWAMVRAPKQALPVLETHLKPVPPPDPKVIAQQIADLNSKSFAVRDAATRELERFAELAGPALAKANVKGVTLETKVRLERLLAALEKPAASADQLRQFRAVEALELLGDAEARKVLTSLAGGFAEARLTQRAKESLLRMAKKRPQATKAHTARPVPKQDLFGDDLPARAVARLGTLQLRGWDVAALTPDGKHIVGLGQGLLHMWDTDTGRELRGYPKPAPATVWYGLAISPDGKWMAASQARGPVQLWEMPSGRMVFEEWVQEELKSSYSVLGVAFSPDSQVLFVGNQSGLRAWNVATKKEVHHFTYAAKDKPEEAPNHVVLSPDGKMLAACRRTTIPNKHGHRIGFWSLALWDVAEGRLQHTLKLDRPGEGAIFSADARILAARDLSGKVIRLWDTATGKVIRDLVEPNGRVAALAFSTDGKTLACAFEAADKNNKPTKTQLHLWDLAATSGLPRIVDAPPYRHLEFARDGKTLVGYHGAICFFDTATLKERRPLEVHRGEVTSVVYSPDGALLATTSDDAAVRLWDAATGKPVFTIRSPPYMTALAFSPDGKSLAGGNYYGEVVLWDVATRQPAFRLELKQSVHAITFAPDGQQFAVGANAFSEFPVGIKSESVVTLWTAAKGKQIKVFKVDGMYRRGLAYTPDGNCVIGCWNDSAQLCNLATGKVGRLKDDVPESPDFFTDLISVAVSPDGHNIAAASIFGVMVLERLTGAARAKFSHRRLEHDMTFSPDGRLLALGGSVWDLATGAELGPFRHPKRHVTSVAFSPDGRRLATASADTTVLVWDLGR